MTRPGVDALIRLAEDLAREAGALLLSFAGRRDPAGPGSARGVSAKSSPTDMVSEADVAAERLIRARLAQARPEDGILGEEGGDVTGTSGLRWVVDPLDGTTNFLFGLPQWAVSVAVEDGEGVLAGVVYDPPRGELWAAVRGGGPPTLDGAPVAASSRDDLGQALVATGFGYAAPVRAAQAVAVARLVPRVRDIRRMGSAALDLAWTAAGRYDAYFEHGVKHWDVAAGSLLCAQAGLEVRPLAAAPPLEAGILVAPARLADVLEAIVAG